MSNPVQQHKQKWKAGDEFQEAIVLSSTFRTNQEDHSTSFTYTFPEPLRKVTSMKLSAIEVPVDVYFSISQYYQNNSFSVQHKNGTKKFIIPDGNYISCQALVDAINQSILDEYNKTSDSYLGIKDMNTSALYATHNNYTITFNYDINQELFEYLLTDTDGAYLNVYFGNHNINNYVGSYGEMSDPNLYRTFGYIAGFRLTSYKLTQIYPFFTGEAASNLSPTKSFLISLDDFNSNGIDNIKVAFHSSFLNKRVLARVPFIRTKDDNSSFLYNKYNDTPVNIRLYKGPTDINKIKVELLDDFGRRVNLQNTDWTYVLTITREP